MMDSTDTTPTDNLDEYGVWVKKAPASQESTGEGSGEDNTEEVSLDDFLGDEIIDDADKLSEAKASDTSSDLSTEEEVSLDEFLDSDDKEDTTPTDEAGFEDEEPMDIDLDFSDENAEDNSVSDDSQSSIIADTNIASEFESVSEGKTVDLDNFDDIFSSLNDENTASAPDVSSSDNIADMADGEVDISVFDSNADSSPSAEAQSGETESVDLADFGFSNDDTESIGSKEAEATITPASKEINMTVVADDDIEQPSRIEENEVPDIPDTFEEETAIFSDDSENTAPSQSSEEKPAAQDNALLSQIAAELQALRSEISSLKNDVEELKKAPPKEAESSTEEPVIEEEAIDIPVADSSDGGFFGGDDDDDTIALSGDELDDILNSDSIQLETDEGSEFEGPSFEEPKVEEPAIEEEAIDIPVADSSDGGFFGGDDDDDTIALSGDELDDILDTANFTDDADAMATAETVDNDILVESSDSEDLMSNPAAQGEDDSENDYDSLFVDADDSVPPSDNIPTSDISEEDAFAILGDEAGEPAKAEEPTETANSDNNGKSTESISGDLREEIKSVLSYMDQLLESLPEDKITEFAQSEQFETYKKLFKELGLA